MTWWGKIVGGAIGFMLGGPLGALFGAALGHRYDEENQGIDIGASVNERIQASFFTATFSVMGHIARSDGQVSREEIAMAEEVIRQMQLDERKKTVAIRLFQQGKAADFPLDEVIRQLRIECRHRTNLLRIFMEIQIQAAMADGRLASAERRILEHITRSLGFDPSILDELLRLDSRTPRTTLADDHRMLGITEESSDAEIKKAYRLLMSRHHPDKLIARGMPEEMVKIATEKTQKIRGAYDRIRESRKKPHLH